MLNQKLIETFVFNFYKTACFIEKLDILSSNFKQKEDFFLLSI